MQGLKKALVFAFFVATLVVLVIGFQKAMVAPVDAQQGEIYRAIYYHVPNAIWALCFGYVNLIGALGVLYFRSRDPLKAAAWDALAIAGAEVTVVYCTVCLVTGSLWGRVAWGIWWTWDERLTTTLLLWLLYVSYLLLRRFSPPGQTSTLASVLSVFAAVDIPIVYFSIRWFRTQHPAPVFGGGDGSGMDKSMYPAFLWNLTAWFLWGCFVMGLRYISARRERQAELEVVL
ncbi:cytochrome c biogenesis protein [Terriglobus albidus]|uniref:cytochrome c biogenesis protein n=1 Tax=Terriglobus albidus TaxID=1592106 RepID=UPI0021E0A81A|nr:cytochrome c biogenesis protein [Terriglobus albidus]